MGRSWSKPQSTHPIGRWDVDRRGSECTNVYIGPPLAPTAFRCSKAGLIVSIGSELQDLGFGFTVGAHYTILFPPLIAKLHKKVFLPRLDKKSDAERQQALDMLRDHTKRASVSIRGPVPFLATASIDWDGRFWLCTLHRVPKFTPEGGAALLIPPLFRGCQPHFEMEANGVSILAIDLANSTEYIVQGIGPYVALQRKLFDEMEKIVLEYHPVLVLHEVLGDAMMCTLNAPWWSSHIISNVHAVAQNFACVISKRLDIVCARFSPTVYVRVGIATGRIVASMSGSRFRIFGKAINMACRLEGCAARGEVCTTDKTSGTDTVSLKGFGDIPVARKKSDAYNSDSLLLEIVG